MTFVPLNNIATTIKFRGLCPLLGNERADFEWMEEGACPLLGHESQPI
jgi:hypothetical protein